MLNVATFTSTNAAAATIFTYNITMAVTVKDAHASEGGGGALRRPHASSCGDVAASFDPTSKAVNVWKGCLVEGPLENSSATHPHPSSTRLARFPASSLEAATPVADNLLESKQEALKADVPSILYWSNLPAEGVCGRLH